MTYITDHLQRGENVVYRIQRSRKWPDIIANLLINLSILAVVLFLFNQAQRIFVESYIRPGTLFGRAEFIVINLFLGVLPIVIGLVLLQDFISTFFVELALTDRRIFGRVPGPFWVREVSYPLYEVDQVYLRLGFLGIQYRGNPVYLSGFHDARGFVRAFRRLVPGIEMEEGFMDPITEPITIVKTR